MEKSTKKVKQHTVYKTSDGIRVPGVTTILNVLNKPALLGWANRMGLQGIDTRSYVDEKADIGTCAHYMIECDIKGTTPDLSIYSPFVVEAAENSYLKWMSWKESQDISFIGSEMVLVSEEHRYGGTIDIYAEIAGKRTLLDIKTSGSGIWPEMKHQTAGGYRVLLEEHGYTVDQVMILRVGRTDDEGFEIAQVSNWAQHTNVFLLCRDLYEALKVAK